jgi:hypothetical protein
MTQISLQVAFLTPYWSILKGEKPNTNYIKLFEAL